MMCHVLSTTSILWNVDFGIDWVNGVLLRTELTVVLLWLVRLPRRLLITSRRPPDRLASITYPGAAIQMRPVYAKEEGSFLNVKKVLGLDTSAAQTTKGFKIPRYEDFSNFWIQKWLLEECFSLNWTFSNDSVLIGVLPWNLYLLLKLVENNKRSLTHKSIISMIMFLFLLLILFGSANEGKKNKKQNHKRPNTQMKQKA